MFGALCTREQLIAKLATVAGLWPGEIFAPKWARLNRNMPTFSSGSIVATSTRRRRTIRCGTRRFLMD